MKIKLIKETKHDGVWYFIKKDNITVEATRNEKEAYILYDKIKMTGKTVTEILKSEEI